MLPTPTSKNANQSIVTHVGNGKSSPNIRKYMRSQ